MQYLGTSENELEVWICPYCDDLTWVDIPESVNLDFASPLIYRG